MSHLPAPPVSTNGTAARKMGGTWPLLYARSLQGCILYLGVRQESKGDEG